MDTLDQLIQGCLEFDEEGSNANCTALLNLDELEFISPEEDESTVLRMKVVAGFYISICFVGLVTNIGLLISLFVGGKQGATFKAPSTILIANLGKLKVF